MKYNHDPEDTEKPSVHFALTKKKKNSVLITSLSWLLQNFMD